MTCSYLEGLRIQTLWYLLSAREEAELSFSVTGPYLQHSNTVRLQVWPHLVRTVLKQLSINDTLHRNFLLTTQHSDWPHVEVVVDVSLDQLHRNEVLPLPAVIEDQPVLVRGLELEVDVYQVVGLHLGRPEVGVVGGEGDWLVYRVLQVVELHIPCKEVCQHNFKLLTANCFLPS